MILRSACRLPALALALALPLLLGACATRPPAPPAQAGDAFYSGRLLLRSAAAPDQAARSLSGGFELRGSPARGELLLTTPLGTTAARARWQDGQATLEADGPPRHFDSLPELLQAAVGEPLPVAALFDWLAGRPWPGAPLDTPLGTAADGSRQFGQLGFALTWAPASDGSRKLDAVRALPAPALRVRLSVDAPTPDGP